MIFLLLLPTAVSQDWLFSSEHITAGVRISGKVGIIAENSRHELDYVFANLSFIPREGFQQDLISIKTSPDVPVTDDSAVFRWDNPEEDELSFSLEADVRSYNRIKGVETGIRFPLRGLPEDTKKYTSPSETADSDNTEIVRKASELIEGESDLYVIVFNLGKWTKENVEYDLSTLTESASQKASWVLKNRQGVCDELTNLFIAMNRALGIPAKFISGVAYTNAKEFGEGFGPHGWAEVYFPGYGWVPFDVTYGEFGFVDAGHIKLKESVDAAESSTQFQWLGRDTNIKTHPLDIDVEVKETYGEVDDLISIDAKAVKDNVGFGSYNLIEAAVENLEGHYVTTELVLSRSSEIEIMGEERKVIVLKPNEEKKVSWIVQVSSSLDEGYIYTFPFSVSSVRNVSSSLRFDAVENGKRFSLEGIESLVNDDENGKTYLGDIELSCIADEDEIYDYEETGISCIVTNAGNTYLEGVRVCLQGNCEEVELGISQEKKVELEFKPEQAGSQEVVIKAGNTDVSRSAFVDIVVYDMPSIEITELVHADEVRYKEQYEISFILDKASSFSPYEVSIKIEPVGKEWKLSQLDEDRKFLLKMYGSELMPGKNDFRILITYKDLNGKSYSTSKELSVSLVDVSIVQRVILFIKGLLS